MNQPEIVRRPPGVPTITTPTMTAMINNVFPPLSRREGFPVDRFATEVEPPPHTPHDPPAPEQ